MMLRLPSTVSTPPVPMMVSALWIPLLIMVLLFMTDASIVQGAEADDHGVTIDIVESKSDLYSSTAAYLRGVPASSSLRCSKNHFSKTTDNIHSMTCTIDEGSFTYYYYNTDSSNTSEHEDHDADFNCQTILLLGVGAAMSSTEYSQLGIDIVTEDSSILAIVVDDSPHEIKKQSYEKYATLVHTVITNIDAYIPVCSRNVVDPSSVVIKETNKQDLVYDQDRVVIIGGHSASGEAAINALPLFFDPSSKYYLPLGIQGFIGLAPYKIEDPTIKASSTSNGITPIVPIPSLYWGFSTKTCAVDVEYAADMAYKLSNPNYRVLYQVQTNNDNFNPLMGGPHCVFSDNGCMKMCNPSNMQWIKNSVAVTVSTFITAIKAQQVEQGFEEGGNSSDVRTGGFSRDTFEKILPLNTRLFVNEEPIYNEESALSSKADIGT